MNWFKKKMAEKDEKGEIGAEGSAETKGEIGAEGSAETTGEIGAEGSAETKGEIGAEGSAETVCPAEPDKPAEPDWKALYAMTLADFDNYKKRAARDREDTYRYAEADILKDILPTVDNLALALAHAGVGAEGSAETGGKVSAEGSAETKEGDKSAEGVGAEGDAFVKGVQLVYDSLLKALKDHGAEPFDSVGLALDTEKMEAIATLPSADIEEGKVSIESKRGWMLKDKVLRVAQVVVSSGKP